MTQTTSIKPLRISRLVERDFMRIESLEVTPGNKSLIVLKGSNGAGKSSGLRGVICALSGKRADPECPIRVGQDRASVDIYLADEDGEKYHIIASWTTKQRYLTLREVLDDGKERTLPLTQTLISGMIGALSFNPLRFIQQPADKRLPAVLEVLGKRQAYDDIRRRRKAFYDDRTETNREVSRLIANFKAAPDPSPDQTLKHQTTDDLKVQLDQIEVDNREIATKHQKLEKHCSETEQLAAVNSERRGEINKLESRIADLENQINETTTDILARREKEVSYAASLRCCKPASTDDILRRISENKDHNDRVKQQVNARQNQADCTKAKQLSEQQTESINALDRQIVALVEDSDLSTRIPGFGITPEGNLTFKGLPIEQMCGKEELNLSCAVGMAANPRLSVMCIDEGDKLDEDGMKQLGEIAEKKHYQFWMTAVYAGKNDDYTHVVQLLDGMVEGAPKADPQAGVVEMYKDL